MADRKHTLEERRRDGQRLGRHVEHDPRSLAYSAGTAALRTVKYKRHGKPFDQGDLGSCTGNAIAGALMTEPFWVSGRTLTENDAVRLYGKATKLDFIIGAYPPNDTGSTGLAVAKAARKEKLISGYAHAFGVNQALGALSLAPCIAGSGWYDSFDRPRSSGECAITASASVRGGHEYELFGLDVERRRVWCYQSWGPTWGALGDGTFWYSFDTFDRLLNEQGDVTTLRR